MLEVEIKFPAADLAALEQRLKNHGARGKAQLHEADHYFNAPDRDFARTDEALRLRRIGAANFVTYKGPKRDLHTKTRTEIEVPLAEGDAAAQDFIALLTHLGYRPVAVVRKQRHIYELEQDSFHVEACLDDVEGVGRFAELEIVATEEQLDAARSVLLKLAAELQLHGSERRSYLEMLLEKLTGEPGA
ncbi:MAG: class IV adenylate cyclase [Gemmataceae bacterium]|nr:class IV adenylate cyclase [Gemmataceae bacterium]